VRPRESEASGDLRLQDELTNAAKQLKRTPARPFFSSPPPLRRRPAERRNMGDFLFKLYIFYIPLDISRQKA
ncbi:MAG: hypothetical protein K6D94_03765, partial [Clostridiales bacterium]|nr:hypothetical protein [Clostridiales bacterium]